MATVRFTTSWVRTVANPDGTSRRITFKPGDELDGISMASAAGWVRKGVAKIVKADADLVVNVPPPLPMPPVDDVPVLDDVPVEDILAALRTIRDRAKAPKYRKDVYASLITIAPHLDTLGLTDDSAMVMQAAISELAADGRVHSVSFADLVDAAAEVVGRG